MKKADDATRTLKNSILTTGNKTPYVKWVK